MDEHQVERTDVEFVASGFWIGWFALSCVATIGLALTGHPIAVFFALVFGAHAVGAIKQMTRSAPGLRITEEGLLDNSHWWHSGLIPWDEIIDVRASRWGMIEIDLRDEQAFWQRLTPIQQLAHWKSQLYGFSPALVVPFLLEGSRSQLVDEMQAGLDQYTLRSGAQSPALPDGDRGQA